MRKVLAVALAASLSFTVEAGAADIGPVSPPVVTVAVPAVTPQPFSFGGAYIGAYGGVLVDRGVDGGIQAGFNIVRGPLLVGVGAELGAVWWMTPGYEAYVTARLGAVLGGRVLGYAEGGIGVLYGLFSYTVAGGVEVGVGRNLSIFGEAKALNWFNGGFEALQFQAGLNWHLN